MKQTLVGGGGNGVLAKLCGIPAVILLHFVQTSQDLRHKCSHQKVEEAVKVLRRGVSLNKRQNNWGGIWPSEEVVSDSVRRQPVKTKTNMSNEALKGADTIVQVCVCVCEAERKSQY